MERIILGYNDSAAAQAARDWAIDQAQVRQAEIVMVYVVSSIWQWELAAAQINPDPITREFDRLLRHDWSEPLRTSGTPYRTELLRGRPADAVRDCAQREDAALIVVGMSTRGTLTELLFGSSAHKLVHEAHRPVVAVPAGWRGPPGQQ